MSEHAHISHLRLAYTRLGVKHWLDLLRYRLGQKSDIPHLLKRRTILEYARRYGPSRFIETGTYLGDMIAAVRTHFQELHTIELSEHLFLKAQKRFASDPAINMHFGDSATVLPRILERCDGPCLFWLDAHYSAGITARGATDSPVTQELDLILSRGQYGDVILVDDASYFKGADGYPTVEEVEQMVAMRKPGHECSMELDIIRIAPRRASRESDGRDSFLPK